MWWGEGGGGGVANNEISREQKQGRLFSTFFQAINKGKKVEMRAKGMCYNRDESYSVGHKCKRLFWSEVPDDESESEEDMVTDLKISLHAISGICNSPIMQLLAKVSKLLFRRESISPAHMTFCYKGQYQV